MDNENINLDNNQHKDNEDRILESLQITDQLLVMLGEAWNRIDILESQVKIFKMGKESLEQSPGPASPEPSEGIVVIDDSRIMQMRLRSSIESLGYKVIGTAENGLVGAEIVVRMNPKLVVLDHHMPDMDGVQCLKAIRLQNSDVKVILCTGGITEKVSQEYLRLGVAAIITKPIQLDRFVAAIRECMSGDATFSEQDFSSLIENE